MIQRKQPKTVETGVIHVRITLHNTIISVSDINGKILCWDSTGHLGFKGSQRGTAFAAHMVAKNLITKMKKFKLKKVSIILKGHSKWDGRETIVRILKRAKFNVLLIQDKLIFPHNGCRPPKKRSL